jgi:hypothetical protein
MISFSFHPWSQTPDKPACTWLAAACCVLSHPDRRRSTAVPSNQFRTRSSEQELKTHQPLWTGCLVHNDGNERKHCDRWHVARNLPWPLKWPSIDRGRVKQPKYREQWWIWNSWSHTACNLQPWWTTFSQSSIYYLSNRCLCFTVMGDGSASLLPGHTYHRFHPCLRAAPLPHTAEV